MKILLIDDEVEFLERAKQLLNRENPQVHVNTSISLEEAVEMLKRDDYDLIISDLLMSDDGKEFLETIKRYYNHTPFIILTDESEEKLSMGAVELDEDRSYTGESTEHKFRVLNDIIDDELGRKKLEHLNDIENDIKIKENKYEHIFHDSPIGLWEIDFSRVKKEIDSLKDQGIEDMKGYLKENLMIVYDLVSKIYILDTNKAALDIYNVDSIEKFKECLLEINQEESIFTFVRALDAISKGLTDFETERVDRTIEGNKIHLWLRWSVVKGFEEDYSKVIVSIIDITEREELEKKFETFMDKLPAGVFIKDEDGECLYGNKYMVDNFEADRWVESNTGYKFPKEIGKKMEEDDKRAIKEGSIVVEEVVPDRFGNIHHFETHKFAFENFDGEQRIGGFAIDITDRKKAEEERNKMRKILKETQEITKVGGWEYDKEMDVFYISDEVYSIYEIPRDLKLNFPEDMLEFYPEESKSEIKNAIEGCIKYGIPFDIESKFITDKGKELWVRTRAKPIIRDDTNTGIIGNIMDITDRKKFEEALRESEEKYRAIIENMQDVYYRADLNGNLIMGSPSGYELLGFENGNKIGKNVKDLYYHPEDMKEFIKELNKNGKVRNYEVVLKDKDGNPITVITSSHFIYDDDGNRVGVEGIISDITKRKKAEEELRKAEKKYRAVFENTGTAMMMVEDDYTISLVNSSFEEYTGYSKEKVEAQMKWTVLVHEDDLERMKMYHENRRKGEKYAPKNYELKLVDKSGKVKHMLVMAGLIPDSNKRIVSLNDITESKETHEALKEESLFNITLLEASPAFFVAMNHEGKVIMMNKTMLNALGYEESEVVGKDYIDTFVPEEDREELSNIFNTITEKNKPTLNENHILKKDGDKLLVEWRGRPIVNEEGELEFFFGVGIDITQSKKNEMEIKRYQENLESMVNDRTKELESFTYSVSHDLRAPLRAMEGFSEALLEDYGKKLNEKGKDYAHHIIDASQRMDKLINDLLDYSHISMEDINLSRVYPRFIIDETLKELEDEIKDIGAKVEVKGDFPDINAYNTTFKQIVKNLVSNSIKFVEKDELPDIEIKGIDTDGRFRLEVKDKGIGIPSEHNEKIFEIFERLHGIEMYDGTGVGLAIVKKGVERMDGNLGVDSEVGKGSTFWVEFDKYKD